MIAEKEEDILKKRLSELVNRAYFNNLCMYTSFLNLNEQSIFLKNEQEYSLVKHCLWGGYENAERKMVCFYTDDNYHFPMSIVKVVPAHYKFCDRLTHRDYLGAMLHLGIDRSKIGDILIEDKEAYVFLEETIEEFMIEQLGKIKHTTVKCMKVEEVNFSIVPKTIEIQTTVSSIRLDAILAAAFRESRSKLVSNILAGKVFVNSKVIESNGYKLQEGDIVSVRGMGKFIFKGMTEKTKKNRCKITISKFI